MARMCYGHTAGIIFVGTSQNNHSVKGRGNVCASALWPLNKIFLVNFHYEIVP
jgi:hypothetical protein